MKQVTKARHEIDSRRERAAGVLDKAGDVVRERSHQAATIIDKGGSRAADALHGSAERIQPDRGFVRRHPKRSALFLVFALLAAFAAFAIIRSQLAHEEEEDDDFDF